MSGKVILGIDEVGRGPWAGPLVIGAVILGEKILSLPEATEIKDSKKFSSKRKRARIARFIRDHDVADALGWVTAAELNHVGLARGLRVATTRAVNKIQRSGAKFDSIILDGDTNFLEGTSFSKYVRLMPKADAKVKAVGAASIIAKVAHDAYMHRIDAKYPGYGFKDHVGYGTAKHSAALKKYGITPEHRINVAPVQEYLGYAPELNTGKEFRRRCRNILAAAETPGHYAEIATAAHLESLGHSVITQNFRTKFYEIDLITIADDKIYFTEVKYSENTEYQPLERITPAKLHQISYAANSFLTHAGYQVFHQFQPILAIASVTGADFQVKEWIPLDLPLK